MEALDPDASTVLTEVQQEVQRLVLSPLDAFGRQADGELRRVLALTDEDTAVGVLLLTGKYAAHAMAANAAGLEPPVPSIFPSAETTERPGASRA